MDFSYSDLYTLCQLSNAAYSHDARPQTEALGMQYITQIGNSQCEVLIAKWGGYSVLAFQGTRVFNNGISLPELWDDIDGDVVVLKDKTRVHGGFWTAMAALWLRIAPLLPPGQPLLTGHSLGGARAHLAKFFLPNAESVSFGAPKAADDAFWNKHYSSPPTRVVYEKDFAPAWPFEGPFTQPSAIDWIHSGRLIEAQQRPGINFSLTDHNIDTTYQPALKKLASIP